MHKLTKSGQKYQYIPQVILHLGDFINIYVLLFKKHHKKYVQNIDNPIDYFSTALEDSTFKSQ